MADDIPQWALTKAAKLSYGDEDHEFMAHMTVGAAFARYIAAHEEQPVDPLLIEARKVCGEIGSAMNAPSILGGGAQRCELIAAGEGAGYYEEAIALAGLRRGMELAGKP